MNPTGILFVVAFAASLLLSSCIKKEEYPDIPRLFFKEFVKIDNGLGYDDQGILTITFTDGDGNIGLAAGDTFPPFNPSSPYYYNFFITYFEKQQGQWVEVEIPFTNNARIPLLNDDDIAKPLKGDVSIELYINNFSSSFDTIRFQAYLTDRDLNHSDTITTPEIIIRKP
ncbi:MAG TPA: hypothetical protein P5550_00750 [Bacteroidales bacterium]|nr:hypothetical protein [Bacteroidales bacterium]HRZ75926.1 hypothetical protein [Bacteroidales bacterium]